MARRPRLLLGAVLALSLTACSAAGPATSEDGPVTSRAGASSAPAPPPASSPAGGIPAPEQRAPEGSAPATPMGPSSAAPATTAPAPTASAEVPGDHADPASADVVVNKRRPLSPVDYAPEALRAPEVATVTDHALLRPDAAAAVEGMFRAAAQDGVELTLVSGYRSYADQEATYAHWVAVYGDADGADAVSARPGHSEHQTGLAFDLGAADGACTLTACFRDTPAARWAADHAAEFGFLLRYPLGADGTTGFFAEPWHFRFVGEDVAQDMRSAGTQTLEEHFGLPAAPSY